MSFFGGALLMPCLPDYVMSKRRAVRPNRSGAPARLASTMRASAETPAALVALKASDASLAAAVFWLRWLR